VIFNEIYFIDKFGIISQKNPQPIDYSVDVMARPGLTYVGGQPQSQSQINSMSALRLNFIFDYIGVNINNLVDFGSGDGDFLREASQTIKNVYSYDIVNKKNLPYIQLTQKELFAQECDVVTFYDSLEHVVDPFKVIEKINAKFVVISVPWCHYETKGESWFMRWKHRKSNEHLHHFNDKSLIKMFSYYGYKLIKKFNIEDEIRIPYDKELPNILTCIFEKKNGKE